MTQRGGGEGCRSRIFRYSFSAAWIAGSFFFTQSATLVLMCLSTSSRVPAPLYSGKRILSTSLRCCSAKKKSASPTAVSALYTRRGSPPPSSILFTVAPGSFHMPRTLLYSVAAFDAEFVRTKTWPSSAWAWIWTSGVALRSIRLIALESRLRASFQSSLST